MIIIVHDYHRQHRHYDVSFFGGPGLYGGVASRIEDLTCLKCQEALLSSVRSHEKAKQHLHFQGALNHQ